MRSPQSLLTTVILSLIATAAWTVITVKMEDSPLTDALQFAPLFFGMIFGTMLLTNRISTSLSNRMASRNSAKQAAQRGPVNAPPTGDRIEHNQRRRQRSDRARADRRRR